MMAPSIPVRIVNTAVSAGSPPHLFRDAHGDRGGGRFRRQRQDFGTVEPECAGEPYGAGDGGCRPRDQRHQHRHQGTAHLRQVTYERNRERDRRRAEQEMHELGTGEIGRKGRATRDHDDRDERHRDQNRIGERMAAAGGGDRIRREIREQRGGEPKERGAGEINPQIDEVGHGRSPLSGFPAASASACSKRARAANTSAVTASVIRVVSTTTAMSRSPAPLSNSRCCTTPTPAGTNSSDRCWRRPSAVLPSVTGSGARASIRTNSRIMPTTGPGKGRSTARTAASPISWQTSRAAIAASMRAPRLRLTRSERAVTLAFSQAVTQVLCSKSISP